MSKLKKILTADDSGFFSENAGVSWVPKNPRELIVPYLTSSEEQEEKGDLETRREKAKEVMNGYAKQIEECKRLEAEIEDRCKDVSVSLEPSRHLEVINALKRVFGPGEYSEITFEMYKICIKEMAKLSNETGAPS